MYRNGITGKDIRVAIIDTSVDYTHPALGGSTRESSRAKFGYDFVGDAYDAINR
jgi:subtilisin family serine protease